MNKMKSTFFLSALYLILSAEEGMATKSACDWCMGTVIVISTSRNECMTLLQTCIGSSGCTQQQINDEVPNCPSPSSKKPKSEIKPRNEKKPGSAKPKSAQLPRKNEKTLKK